MNLLSCASASVTNNAPANESVRAIIIVSTPIISDASLEAFNLDIIS